VAIDRYANGVPCLRTPVTDAEKLSEVLTGNHGFDTLVLENEGATLQNSESTCDLQDQIGPDDRMLFYFAGHGIALESDDGPKGYVLPQDADRSTNDRFLSMADLNKALSVVFRRASD
jgi:uncharacterized caspase-like protein